MSHHNPCIRNLTIHKIDKTTGLSLGGAGFELLNHGITIAEGITDADGLLVFQVMPCKHYILRETEAPDGYKRIATELDIFVDACGEIFVVKRITDQLIVKNEPDMSVSGSKTWFDNNNSGNTRPEEITINLYQDGTLHRQARIPTVAETTPFAFESIEKYRPDGSAYAYTVAEDVAQAGYNTVVTGTNIVNTLQRPYVLVRYYDLTGGRLLAEEAFRVLYGASFTAFSRVIPNYELQGPESYTFDRVIQNETYTFEYTQISA